MKLDEADLIQTVRFLESSPLIDTWSICKISHEHHIIPPFGKGYGLTVHGRSAARAFEKAGRGRSLFQAALRALERLQENANDRRI